VSERRYLTVVETRPFMTEVERCLSTDEREQFIEYIACDPTAGAVIRETGGVRKVRWGATGRGKRGGVRVIYYYHSERIPLFLLTVYAKAQKTDLSPREKAAMRRLVAEIVEAYFPKRA
jgi:mRNA-degrading endonuclease RelE of RelBE toxin-antitoxin system